MHSRQSLDPWQAGVLWGNPQKGSFFISINRRENLNFSLKMRLTNNWLLQPWFTDLPWLLAMSVILPGQGCLSSTHLKPHNKPR